MADWIYFHFEIDDTLTDPTSVVLSDSTAAYGIRNQSTGAIEVAAGTAVTKEATGVYKYDVSGLGKDYAYDVGWKAVYDGATYYLARVIEVEGGTNITQFSEDADLLKIHRSIFTYRDRSTLLASGTAATTNATGTTLTKTGETFVTKGVESGHVACLRIGTADKEYFYEISSVTETALTFAGKLESGLSGLGTIAYDIWTFGALHEEAFRVIMERKGWKLYRDEDDDQLATEYILNQADFVLPNAYLAAALVMESATGDAAQKLAEGYRARYLELIRNVSIEIDTDSLDDDGKSYAFRVQKVERGS